MQLAKILKQSHYSQIQTIFNLLKQIILSNTFCHLTWESLNPAVILLQQKGAIMNSIELYHMVHLMLNVVPSVIMMLFQN